YLSMSFHRLYRVCAFAPRFLLVDLISSYISTVNALPVIDSVVKKATSPAGVPIGPKPHDNVGDRNSPFQVLADGTQDLAALVGIFATNSVERYAVDHTKGYISVASTTLSLLGLLGYVRALVKLGLGLLSCQNAGFDTRSLRPLFGIPDEDRLPSDAVHNVYYVERSRLAQNVRWKLVATRKHTVDSMPILDLAVQHPVDDVERVMIHSYCLNSRVENWYRFHAWYRIPMIFAFMVALTCFPIAALRGRLWSHGWTMIHATFGLFFSLWVCSIMWSMVYAQEQLPKGDTDWIRRVKEAGVCKQKSSLERKDYFAFASSNYSYAMFDLKAVTGWPRIIARTVSLAGALSAIIGYICQYVEVRQTSATQAIVWLAIQGLLAMFRIAIWVWNPEFDDLTTKKERTLTHIQLSEAQLVMLWYSHIHPKRVRLPKDPNLSLEEENRYRQEIKHKSQACPLDFNCECIPDELTIPTWVLHGLDIAETNIQDMFADAFFLFLSQGSDWREAFQTVAAIELFWDMPEWIFMLWIDAHTEQQLRAEKVQWKSSFGCRVIQNADGRIQLIPFWMIDCLRLSRKAPDRKSSIYPSPRHTRSLKYCVFGNPESEDRCILTACRDNFEDASMRRCQHLMIGYEPFKTFITGHNTDLEDLLKEIGQQYKEMWAKLRLIAKRARILNAAREKLEALQLERMQAFAAEPGKRLSPEEEERFPGVDGDFLHFINTYPDDNTIGGHCRNWWATGGTIGQSPENASDESRVE
ncbi:MAG: hypothetical protein Q9224_005200, partial [Gallowayella concinna]